MNKKSFDNLHKDKGGFAQLKRRVIEGQSLKEIAEHFGVCKNAVRMWCLDLFGKKYDPRLERRKAIVDEMVEYARKHSEKDFRKKYLKKSKYYYYIALSECYAKGIYRW